MMYPRKDNGRCPVAPYERAGEGYAEAVGEWLANPHAFFRAFGPEAREFQRHHRSERLRIMTLVAPAAELAALRPKCVCLDGSPEAAASWETVFATALSRLAAANPQTFAALQRDGELAWLGCEPEGVPLTDLLAAGTLRGEFASLTDVVLRIQWLFLMCGIRLNEVIAQVDPYTDEGWKVRKAAIDSRRAADKAFLEGRLAAQKAWAEAHPDEAAPSPSPADRWGE